MEKRRYASGTWRLPDSLEALSTKPASARGGGKSRIEGRSELNQREDGFEEGVNTAAFLVSTYGSNFRCCGT